MSLLPVSSKKFELVSEYTPKGDQPLAIKNLVKGLKKGTKHQTLLGATGTGKTYTIANVIEQVQKPTLVMAHNKTLAAQLCSEFREFFPKNAVHYFVSYYDYYQPEAYNPISDVYIEKDASINDEINKFRHAATANLLSRRDVIIVASVSCIYGLGSPQSYLDLSFEIKVGTEIPRDRLLRKLTDLQYNRSTTDFKQGMFHVLGDVVEIFLPGQDTIYRLDFFGDEIESIVEADAFTGEVVHELESVRVFPAKHSVTTRERVESALQAIRADMEIRLKVLREQGRGFEAERLKTRTEYDLEILQETGYCPGIENYTRYLNDLKPGQPSSCLLDFFPDDFLMVIDESHITIPQVGAMYNGNYSRKENLVNYGFRLPSAHDNRPLKFDEFEKYMNPSIFVSATPSKYEYANTKKTDIVQQIIRPTGLLDPEVVIRPTKGQVLDLLDEINVRTKRGERILVTTLTKRSAEDLTEFMTEKGVRVRYLHSDIDTMERVEILRDLRLGEFDVLIGINLLREGLDLPEVSLVAILDADKEGFLRSATALIQTIGRAARNAEGRVIMYADRETDSMKKALSETARRRVVQEAYNVKHGITPETIIKAVHDLAISKKDKAKRQVRHYDVKKIPKDEVERLLRSLETEMDLAAQNMEFEKAAELRDEIDGMREEFGL
jgi:excinuclease ABC subunit B